MDPLRVLIVDDDEEVCSLIKYQLMLSGEMKFDVVSLSKNFESLSSFGTFKSFDCLVLDLWLTPNGILEEFPMAHKIFSWARTDNPHMPIVIFSAVIGLQHRQDIEDEAEIDLPKTSINKIAEIIKIVTQRRRIDDLPAFPQKK